MRVALALLLVACSEPEPAAPPAPVEQSTGKDRVMRAFDPAGHFDPLPKPGPDDWLATQEEEGQTFEQYVASQPNLPRPGQNTIYVLPIGDLAGGPSVRELEDYAERFFQLPVEILPAVTVESTGARTRMNDGVRQLLAPMVTDWLRTQLPADAYCLIGLTMTDLYPQEDWNFVFGQASLSERVGVFSFARYDYAFYGAEPAAPQRVFHRAMKVMTHEIGHMFGIQHCIHWSCDMNGSNNLSESDRQPAEPCPVCLRKLHHAIGFDPAKRFRDLAEFYDAKGYAAEAAFVRKRLAHMESG